MNEQRYRGEQVIKIHCDRKYYLVSRGETFHRLWAIKLLVNREIKLKEAAMTNANSIEMTQSDQVTSFYLKRIDKHRQNEISKASLTYVRG